MSGCLDRARRTLHTGEGLLTDRPRDRPRAVFAADEHVQVQVTWGTYQRMVVSCREVARSSELAPFAEVLHSSDAFGLTGLHLLGARVWCDAAERVYRL